MSGSLQKFADVFLGLTQPLTVVGANVKSKSGQNSLQLTLTSLLLWVVELVLVGCSAYISNVTSSVGGSASTLQTITIFLIIRASLVGLSVVVNLSGFFVDPFVSKNRALMAALSLLEVGTIVTPLILLAIAQEDIKSTTCSGLFPEGDPFTDKSEDLSLSYAYNFHVLSIIIRLIRTYAIASLNGSHSSMYAGNSAYSRISEPANAKMSAWSKRKQEYNAIRKNAREEITYNFSSGQGIVRHDLI